MRRPRLALAASIGAAAVLASSGLATLATAAEPGPGIPDEPASALHASGRWLVDGHGRAVILHGLNQVSKIDPYLPSAIGFGQDDAEAIASFGFNTVRTGVHHKAIAPEPGVYDLAYIEDFVQTVQVLEDAGLYVLVDFHHDMYNERYQGNGFADWATIDSWPANPSETVPQCMAGFPGNYFVCQFLWEANDNFYGISGRSPVLGPRGMTLQEEFAEAWEPLAAALADRPLVFGFNILNEPTPGSQVLACLNPTGCPPATDAALREFSNLVALSIRDVDPTTMVWYEPWATNFNAGFPTYHGDLDIGDVGFSYHVYACPFAIPGVPVPDPGLSEECDTIREQDVFTNANEQAEKYGHPPLVTEFGATDDLGTIRRIADLADLNLTGWQYWAWWNEDPCCERPSEGIITHPSDPPTPENLKQDKLDVLVRGYPRAVAGTPTSWSWDGTDKVIEVAWDTAPVEQPLAQEALTEIWVPARHYPDGYQIEDLVGAEVVSGSGTSQRAERLLLRNLPGAATASLRVTPGDGTEQPAPTPAPDAEPQAPPAVGPSTLPATGGGLAVLGSVVAAATLTISRRRRG